MAYRTTAAEVRVLSDDFEDMTDAELVPHIASAHILVTDQGIADDSASTSTKLELITRWLAAHFATVSVREATQERAGDVSATYEGNAAKGARLESTRFGRNAILLDDTGALVQLNALKTKAQSAGMKTLWTEPDSW